MHDPIVEFLDISPALAADFLTRNTHNRPIRERIVRAYAEDMRNGNWQTNGDAIRVSVDDVLLDGQHRLRAVVESGVTIRMLVIHGLESETQDTVDGGAKRKFADVLVLRGHKNAITLASTLRLVAIYERAGKVGAAFNNVNSVTNAQMLDSLANQPWLEEGMNLANRVHAKTGLPASIAGFTWWLFAQIDAEDAEAFFEQFISGENLRRGHPIYTLRSALDSSQQEVRGERSRKYLGAIVVKAWNGWRRGEDVLQLRFRLGGAQPEQFPEPA